MAPAQSGGRSETRLDLTWASSRLAMLAADARRNLMLHLAGNVRQWVISGLGMAADQRQRQQEFDERGPLPRAELLNGLKQTVEEADVVLAGVSPCRLPERRQIHGSDVTVLGAIYHVAEHFSMHTGQIILLTKM